MADRLATHPLFSGIETGLLPGLLAWLGAAQKKWPRGAWLLRAGEPAGPMGILLAGAVQVQADDLLGNRRINAALGPGDLFGESLALAGVAALPVSVQATQDSVGVLLNIRRCLEQPGQADPRLLANLLGILAAKNRFLNQRLDILARRTTREKLLAYLGGEAARAASRRFTIPFDRQGLADYLCVERSAMSAELSRMAAEGLLRTHRSVFELLV